MVVMYLFRMICKYLSFVTGTQFKGPFSAAQTISIISHRTDENDKFQCFNETYAGGA